MFLHRYIDPKMMSTWNHGELECKKTLLSQLCGAVLSDRRHKVDFPTGLWSGSNWKIEKTDSTNPKEALNFDSATICEASIPFHGEFNDIHTFLCNFFVKFPTFSVKKLWKNTWRLVDDKKAVSRRIQEQSPSKRDWEGGPGKLSRADLTKNCRSTLHDT